MLRHGIPRGRGERAAVGVARVPGLGRARRRHARAAPRRGDGVARRARCRCSTARATAPPTRSSSTRAPDPARGRPPARPHLLQPADHPATRRLGRVDRRRSSPTWSRCARRARWTWTSCSPATATRSPIIAPSSTSGSRFHRRRAEKLHGLIAERPRTAYELAQALWGNIAVTQAYLTLSEVLGHTDLLLDEGRVREMEATAWCASRRSA